MYQKSLLPPVPSFPPQNVASLVLHRPDQDQWPDFSILTDAASGKTRSLKEHRERVSLASTALANLNLAAEHNDMVGILSDNCFEYYTIIHSLLTITTPFALFPAQSTVFELVHLLKLSKATKLFVQPKHLANARQAAKLVGLSDEHILILEGHSHGRRSLDDLIRDVQERRLPRVRVKPVKRDTLAYLAFSSGTTGLPKGVMISHCNTIFTFYQGFALSQVEQAGNPPPQLPTKDAVPVMLAFLPLYHSYGLQLYAFRCFAFPSTQLMLPRWDLDTIFRVVPKYRVSILPLIPSAVHQLVNHPKFQTTDWSSVTSVICGAAYLPRDLGARFAKRLGVNHVSQGYGLSESTLSAMVMPDSFPGVAISPDSVGLLGAGMEARIVRDDGTDAGVNEIGELWLKGGNIAMGYYNDEKATKEVFLPDGWLRTGDRFRTDGKGVYFFEDRAKDTLKVSGSQVSPTEIEAAIVAHPGNLITDVTVAGVSGGRTSDEKVPRAWVVLSATGKQRGEATTREELTAWTEKNLARYKWLRGGIEFVPEIPKSATGKVLRRVLQDKYEAQVARSAKL